MLDPDKPRVQFGSTLVRMTVFILVVLLTILLVAVVVISQSIHHTAMQKMVGIRNLRAVQAASASIESELSRTTDQLLQINAEQLKGPSNPDGVFNSEFPLGIYSFSCPAAEVKVISTPLNSVNISDKDIPTAEFCQSGIENQSPRVKYVLTEIQAKQVLWLADGNGNQLDGDCWSGSQSDAGPPACYPAGQDNLAILVYDLDHTLRYETGERPAGDHTLYHASILSGLQGSSGVMLPVGGHGSHIVTYTPVAGVNWILVMDEAWEDISNPSLDTTQWIPLILIPVVVSVLTGFLSWLQAYREAAQSTPTENQADWGKGMTMPWNKKWAGWKKCGHFRQFCRKCCSRSDPISRKPGWLCQ